MTRTSVCDSSSLQVCYKKALTTVNIEITPRENSTTKKWCLHYQEHLYPSSRAIGAVIKFSTLKKRGNVQPGLPSIVCSPVGSSSKPLFSVWMPVFRNKKWNKSCISGGFQSSCRGVTAALFYYLNGTTDFSKQIRIYNFCWWWWFTSWPWSNQWEYWSLSISV